MTDRQFWKQLDDLSKKEFSMQRDMEFMRLLKKGYEEECGILISCFYDQKFPNMALQSYLDMDGIRYMICFTNKKNARMIQQDGVDWNIASTKDILNNFFNKDAIGGLLFNPYCENMVMIFKPILQEIMPGKKEKPPFYREGR